MKVIVQEEGCKFYNGKDYIFPHYGEEIDLPDELAKAELNAGFVISPKALDSKLTGEDTQEDSSDTDTNPSSERVPVRGRRKKEDSN